MRQAKEVQHPDRPFPQQPGFFENLQAPILIYCQLPLALARKKMTGFWSSFLPTANTTELMRSNQLRLYFSTFAYQLMQGLRRLRVQYRRRRPAVPRTPLSYLLNVMFESAVNLR
jgi:hypothetical protein